jgi:predicted amidohydrolase YtcJ
MQPVHCDPAYLPNWVEVLGSERAHRGFAWPEYLAHGTKLAFGTDTPTAPYQSLPNMYIAATRKSPGDASIAPHRPDFALPLDQAIGHATRDAAWASHMEAERGMLRAGLAADLVILDSNPLAADASVLLSAAVVATIVGGETAFTTRQ